MAKPNLKWSSWQELTDSVPTAPGVYQIRSCTPRGVAHPVPRLLGKDAAGILSIGHSSSLERRRKQFQSGVSRGYGHSEGNLLYRLRTSLAVHPRTRVLAHVEWRVALIDTPKAFEERLIKTYVLNFGEPPPLNSAIPNRYGDW